MQKDWYRIQNAEEVDSPALLIYLDRVKANIRTAIEMTGDVSRLRPHVKTHKCTEVILLMLDAGIRKFKCATVAEAEMLAMAGAPDTLLAYQPVGPKVQRFLSLLQTYPQTRFSCLVDNEEAATRIAKAATEAGFTVPVFIDINAGMNRTGIAPGRLAVALYQSIARQQGLQAMGLHVYDGHIRNPNLQARTLACREAFAPVEATINELTQMGFEEPLVIAGGSPTFPVHAKRSNVECSPGTFVYWDKGYELLCPEQAFLPAALVLTRVVSLPAENRLCLDLGHKSIAAENDLLHRVHFLNAPALKPVGQSEEHLVMEIGKGHSYKIGDTLYGLPHHVCPTCALYEKAFVVESGRVTGAWKTVARDRQIGI